MAEHVLREFTADRLSTVEQDWRQLAGDDEFDSELSPMFGWCASHINHQDGDSQALELFDPVREKADAILEVVNTRQGRMTKLLKLYISPEFWGAEDDDNLLDQIAELHGSAYAEVLVTGIAQGVREVKIYGRTNLMLDLLRRVHMHWNPVAAGWSTKMQGRWLAISLGN